MQTSINTKASSQARLFCSAKCARFRQSIRPSSSATPTRNSKKLQNTQSRIAPFLADEKAAAIIRPSRDGKNGGGSGGTIFDDNGAALGRQPYLADHKVKIPVVV